MKKQQDLDFDWIRKGILEEFGYTKYVSAYDENEERFNNYTNIQHKISRFIDVVNSPDSGFLTVGFNNEELIKIGTKIIGFKEENEPMIYNKIKNHSHDINLDFLLDVKEDIDLTIPNIPLNRLLAINFFEVDEKYEKYERYYVNMDHYDEAIHKLIQILKHDITDKYKNYNLLEYGYNNIKAIKSILDASLEYILEFKIKCYRLGYYDVSPCYILNYIDLIDHTIAAAVYLIQFRTSIHVPGLKFVDRKDFFDKILHGIKKIEVSVKDFLNNLKKDPREILNIDKYNEKIKILSNYLKYKEIYSECILTNDALQKEVKESFESFDEFEKYFKYYTKFNKTKTDTEKGKIKKAKILITEGERTTEYIDKTDTIRKFRRILCDKYENNFIDYTVHDIKILFEEIYIRKIKSPILDRTASSIIKSLETSDILRPYKFNPETNELLEKVSDINNFSILEQQKIRFLDLKIWRGVCCSYLGPNYYYQYCTLRNDMWKIFLMVFEAENECQIYKILHYIGSLFTDLLLDNE